MPSRWWREIDVATESLTPRRSLLSAFPFMMLLHRRAASIRCNQNVQTAAGVRDNSTEKTAKILELRSINRKNLNNIVFYLLLFSTQQPKKPLKSLYHHPI